MNQSTFVSGEGTLADTASGTIWSDCSRALHASAFLLGARVPVGTVATGVECEAFRRWIDALPEQGNDSLVQLRQWGYTYDLAALRVQLKRALEVHPAGIACRGVARRLLDLLGRLQGAVCFLLEEGPPGR
jgi:hypothetical protein